MESDLRTSLKPWQLEELQLIGAMIGRGEPPTTIEVRWKEFLKRSRDELAQGDICELVLHVLREAYLENNKDLQFCAEKVKYYNALKKQIRDELKKTRKIMEKHIDCLEQSLSSIGDDAQLANIDLQNMLQKQQQTVQLMSNISKMLHDTAMSIIRKIG